MKLDVRGKAAWRSRAAIRSYVEKKLRKIEKVFNEELEAVVVCKYYRDLTKVEIADSDQIHHHPRRGRGQGHVRRDRPAPSTSWKPRSARTSTS
ncbi:MAG: HPF/RaiA family ribosome-associated protein [Bacillus subtilis]|nr:HPF/RaiA family ribosome-associated protein [Bacillus subtilis]